MTMEHHIPTTTQRPIAWKSSGLHLTAPDAAGWLEVTPDFLRAYYTRPEIHPVDESCEVEHRLFERLMMDPLAPVGNDELAAMVDQDTAENYRLLLRYRDHLVKHGTLEGAYLGLFSETAPRVPPVFYEQLVHVILAHILDGEEDPFVYRAAEIFFRDQKVTIDDEQLMLADAEVVEMYSQRGGLGGLDALLADAGMPQREISLDVLSRTNAGDYADRADQFNFALDFRYTRPGLDAFARVVERWVRHFLNIEIRVTPLQSVRDEHWSWHVGLDAEATGILNALYNEDPLPEGAVSRIAALFRTDFLEQESVSVFMRGKPAYLGLAMTPDNVIRMKPQNILVNLPLRREKQ
ncbi:hypothetical protein HDIA_1751 [Hartmannibacter diazotrophicus]|uniref:Uncharacterized protein n=1 Tax=Hartmannibacter diazotrophicus TaxID=1482074 RepID=A0A2C9D4N5_9HYPH|nr:DUF6352 family protein [Hartmannibacter diazotrophicus]SON55292.1 hypothetical protein HDIA_1751 [Hartmannibacter diazotrophicus]